MLNIIKLLLKIFVFTVLASLTSAVLLHFYAGIIYKFKLADDWYYIRNANSISDLLSQQTDEFFFAFFSLGFAKKLLRKRKPPSSDGSQKYYRREPIST